MSKPSLEVNAPPSLVERVRELENAVKGIILQDSQRFSKVVMTQAMIDEGFHSSISERPGYDPRLKVKISASTCFWDGDGQSLPQETNLRAAQVAGRCFVPGIWIMGKTFGLSFSLNDLLVLPPPERVCPFT
jgi:hypothetical protein